MFINDHWQLAIEHGAYGVHLGQEDLQTADLPAIAKAGLHLGISTHSYFEAAKAKSYHPSYVALGPIFETTCKSMTFGPQGFDRISEWRGFFEQGLVAIGGLQLQHAQEVAKRGADGLALISDVLKASNPHQRVAEWLDVERSLFEAIS